MPEFIWLLGALFATLAGMAWIALAMPAHWQQVFGSKRLSTLKQSGLRLSGACALCTALGLCLAADHISMAVLVWFMLLTMASVLVASTLSWRPTWLRAFCFPLIP
jgi:hypothetical protein